MSSRNVILEQYINNVRLFETQLPVNYWFDNYFKAIFCMARVYDGTNKDCANSMYCFINSLANIVPNAVWSNEFKRFILMTNDVKSLLQNMSELKTFFKAYGHFEKILYSQPNMLLQYCLQDRELIFAYCYVMYIYMLTKKNLYSGGVHKQDIYIPSYNDIKRKFNPDVLTKADWGRPTWFIIHTAALYSPSKMTETQFVGYYKFLDCLRHILPCEVCKAHLSQNITFIDFNNCGRNNIDLFKCTWELHNIVNRSINKTEPSLNEAVSFYIPNQVVGTTYHKYT
jgi:hypothetical protein